MTNSLFAVLSTCISLQLVSGFVFEIYAGGLTGSNVPIQWSDIPNYMPNLTSSAQVLFTDETLGQERWVVFDYFCANDTSTVNNINSIYSAVDVATIDGQLSVGNLIVCPECDSYLNFIGPFSCAGCTYAYTLYNKWPLYMNSNLDLVNITTVSDRTDDSIIITAYFYNVYAEDSSNYDPINGRPRTAIANHLFPNASITGAYFGSNGYFNNTRPGMVYATYYDVHLIFANLGDPSDWPTIYDEYNWQQDQSENYYFIYGFSVECSNDGMYQLLLAGPTTPTPTMANSTSKSSNIIYVACVILCSFLFCLCNTD